ncbi:MAG: hypothetical protein PHR79_10190 [Bacteroidales bacterium]|jgi:esterase/lipase|nr:hypothetical protein [Bacteroidales bacterium]
MVSQNFIQSENSSIFSVIKYPEKQIAENAVLLIPGFGESKCDLDYFLSNLANFFIENNFATMQLDLFAHGDSYGSFEDLNSGIIIKNIISAIKHLKKTSNLKIYVVCRGFYTELLTEKNILDEIHGLVGISPIKLNVDELERIENALLSKERIIEFCDFENRQTISKILAMLGAEPDNMFAQKININFLNDIIERLKKKKWSETSYNNAVWLTSNLDTQDLNIEYKYSEIQYKTLDFYEGYAFPRDIYWQHKFTLNILSNIIRMSKGRLYAHTISV